MERLTVDETLKLVNKASVQMELDNCKECSENYKQIAEYLEELKSYKDLEERGLLVRLPCKVGDSMFRINKGAKNPIIELTVAQINITRKSYKLEAVDKYGDELMYFKEEIGNAIFITREEAEKKLEELRN